MSYYNTIFKTYSCLKNESDVYRWYPYKHFRSKHSDPMSQRIIFKIVKSSIYDSCNDKVVYDESVSI